jgi:hypothetical protein
MCLSDMKSLTFILASLLFLCACEENEPSGSTNSFSAHVNNDFWTGTTEFQTEESSDTLTIFGTMDQPEGYFWVRVKFDGARVYTLTRNQVGYTSLIGGDVATSRYIIDPDKPGAMTISAFNTSFTLVEGTFEFELKKEMGNPNNQFPEVLNFTSGNLKSAPNP